MLVKRLLIFLLLIIFSLNNRLAYSASIAEIQQNIEKTTQYFNSDKEALPYDEVVSLSSAIIRSRQFYNNNTIAKVFILLADAATNKGDLVKAMQFALDGKTLLGIDKSLELSLMLKIANGYYIKGRFDQVNEIVQQAVVLASQIDDPKYLLKSLGYRAMSNALIAKHQLAFADLKRVELLLEEHQEFTDHVELLEILAVAHYYLNDNSVAITLYSKVIKLRFDQGRINNIGRIYNRLARVYLRAGQLDDAYNAFWLARTYAREKNAPIIIAYAELGLGQVLLQQHKEKKALDSLQKAEQLFHGQNLTKPYLTTLISLAKTATVLKLDSIASDYLLRAETVTEQVDFTQEQIELFYLLADVYQSKGQFEKALLAQKKYVDILMRAEK